MWMMAEAITYGMARRAGRPVTASTEPPTAIAAMPIQAKAMRRSVTCLAMAFQQACSAPAPMTAAMTAGVSRGSIRAPPALPACGHADVSPQGLRLAGHIGRLRVGRDLALPRCNGECAAKYRTHIISVHGWLPSRTWRNAAFRGRRRDGRN